MAKLFLDTFHCLLLVGLGADFLAASFDPFLPTALATTFPLALLLDLGPTFLTTFFSPADTPFFLAIFFGALPETCTISNTLVEKLNCENWPHYLGLSLKLPRSNLGSISHATFLLGRELETSCTFPTRLSTAYKDSFVAHLFQLPDEI